MRQEYDDKIHPAIGISSGTSDRVWLARQAAAARAAAHPLPPAWAPLHRLPTAALRGLSDHHRLPLRLRRYHVVVVAGFFEPASSDSAVAAVGKLAAAPKRRQTDGGELEEDLDDMLCDLGDIDLPTCAACGGVGQCDDYGSTGVGPAQRQPVQSVAAAAAAAPGPGAGGAETPHRRGQPVGDDEEDDGSADSEQQLPPAPEVVDAAHVVDEHGALAGAPARVARRVDGVWRDALSGESFTPLAGWAPVPPRGASSVLRVTFRAPSGA